MERQIHGGDIYRNHGALDFSVNSNPLGTPEAVLRAVRETASQVCCYPDMLCEKLRQAVSRFEQVPACEILCGNGAAELFFAAAAAIKPGKALLVAPSFSEYERALRVWETDVRYYRLARENEFQVEEGILEAITGSLDLLFLCNPNNPTGLVIEKDLMKKILEKCRKCEVLVVLDECFIEFLDEPERYEMKSRLEEFPNLFLVKAFTKIFAMPGLRLGYGMSSNAELLKKIRSTLQPWNVSGPAQAAGAAALADCGKYLEETRKYLSAERAYLSEELEKLGFHVYPSRANYLFFSGRKGIYEEALKAGFLIRDCSGYEGLGEGDYRIAIRTREENERLLTWLRRL